MSLHRETDRNKLFTRRTALLAGGKGVLLSLLVGRMYYLQVVESDRYITLADENRINIRLLPPPRGRIVDRFGRPMAVNRQNYRLVLVSEQTPDVEATLDGLSRVVRLSPNERQRILREVRRKRSFVPVTVRENLSWEEVARIEVNTPDLPGVMIDVGQSRHYTSGDEAAHLLGYVAAVSEAEQTGDPLLQLPGFRIGKAGVEKVYDLALRGKGGNSHVEVNAVGRVIRELERQEGQPGAEVALTIDMELQKMAAARMGDESGAVVVLDVQSGAVLAMASTPGYDPNAFTNGLSSEEWRNLVGSPRAPLINKAIAGQYSPGSTFKMAVALAALEKGAINPNNTVFCPGYVELGNARFHCWKRGGHGAVNMIEGLQHSCDVYFYEVAKRTGIERIAAMARRLGMGSDLGIDLPGEQSGVVPDREWKAAAIGGAWQKGETLIAGIGQGYILTTPLQLAVMTARIANGGLAVTPHLTRDLVKPDKVSPRPEVKLENIGLLPQHLKLVHEGMYRVVNDPAGTAHRSALDLPGIEMAGKTGTAQVRRISKAERETGVRKNEDLPWEERDHALFVCFAPYDAPRYAVTVVVEHGGGGSAVAAPIARDIMTEVLRRDPARSTGGTRVAGSQATLEVPTEPHSDEGG